MNNIVLWLIFFHQVFWTGSLSRRSISHIPSHYDLSLHSIHPCTPCMWCLLSNPVRNKIINHGNGLEFKTIMKGIMSCWDQIILQGLSCIYSTGTASHDTWTDLAFQHYFAFLKYYQILRNIEIECFQILMLLAIQKQGLHLLFPFLIFKMMFSFLVCAITSNAVCAEFMQKKRLMITAGLLLDHILNINLKKITLNQFINGGG